MLTYKGFGLGFQINGRFGGVVTSSTEALLDRFGVSKRSAEAREAGGVLLKGQGLVDAKSYYQMTGTGNYETSGYYVYLSLIHISEPTRLGMISYAVFCLKKKKKCRKQKIRKSQITRRK